ncbi:aquaporin AQPAe.a-like isoform X5 [Onthophagus taurus]|uniref:aquaporin AQPAe.a-like isoform X5 n=1 Tax=Onthophagus taurus TaxID=166361 RepID=UPI000C207F28|nr:aquaporin AQPAe.a-like isoform X1 [Onthophagus taurus]
MKSFLEEIRIRIIKYATDKKSFFETIIRVFLAEFFGTAMLLFIGCMGCAFDLKHPFPGFAPALTFGLAVMVIVQIFLHISGSHINPIITIAVVIFGAMKPLVAGIYITAQMLGGIFGFGLIKLLLTEHFTEVHIPSPGGNGTIHHLCVTQPNPYISPFQATAIEAITSGILILLLCGITDKRNHANTDSLPLRFGFAITGLASASAQFTGGSMNPARSFAPALLNGIWSNQWIYWVGPTAGAITAALFYKFLYYEKPEVAKPDELQELDEIGDNGTKA